MLIGKTKMFLSTVGLIKKIKLHKASYSTEPNTDSKEWNWICLTMQQNLNQKT